MFPLFQSGLRQFYEQHEEVMQQIKQQHDNCLLELAGLEEEIIPDAAMRHFTLVPSSLNTA